MPYESFNSYDEVNNIWLGDTDRTRKKAYKKILSKMKNKSKKHKFRLERQPDYSLVRSYTPNVQAPASIPQPKPIVQATSAPKIYDQPPAIKKEIPQQQPTPIVSSETAGEATKKATVVLVPPPIATLPGLTSIPAPQAPISKTTVMPLIVSRPQKRKVTMQQARLGALSGLGALLLLLI